MPTARHGLRALCIGAAGIAVASSCLAQDVARGSPAVLIADAVLGRLPGTVAVGKLGGGSSTGAVRTAAGDGGPPATLKAEPIFEIGSLSKVFTGLLLAQAVDKGTLRLSDTLGALLEGSVSFSSRNTAGITLGQLVTHTSCLPGLPENANAIPAAAQITQYTRDQLWHALAGTRIASQAPCPGAYSNFGFAVLGELLSQRAGKPWSELVRTQVTGPLGMRDTVQTLSPAQERRRPAGFVRNVAARPWTMTAFAGAGGLHSTVPDLLVFSKALMAGRKGPLGPAAERLTSPLAPYGQKGTWIGYGVFLPATGSTVWVNAGLTDGFAAEWIAWPDRGEAIVILVSNIAAPSRLIADRMVREK